MVKVRPKFIFTRANDQLQRVLDWEDYPTIAKEITFTSEGGHWARRGPDGLSLTTAEAGAIVDANHDGSWEESSPLPGTTPNFVVGARAEDCSCVQSMLAARTGKSSGSATVYPAQTTEAELLASHTVDPPTFMAASYSLNKDNASGGGREPEEPKGGKPAERHALPLFSLGLLVLGLTAIPWLRRK